MIQEIVYLPVIVYSTIINSSSAVFKSKKAALTLNWRIQTYCNVWKAKYVLLDLGQSVIYL